MLQLTVGENIYLGRLPTGAFGKIKTKELHEKAQKIIDDFGLHIKDARQPREKLDV